MKTVYGKKLLKEVNNDMQKILKDKKDIANTFARLTVYDYDNTYFKGLIDRFSELQKEYREKQELINTMIAIESEIES